MSNLLEIKRTSDVRETLEKCLEQSDRFECVIVLAITKEDEKYLRTSSINQINKSYLSTFLNWWVNKWFDDVETSYGES